MNHIVIIGDYGELIDKAMAAHREIIARSMIEEHNGVTWLKRCGPLPDVYFPTRAEAMWALQRVAMDQALASMGIYRSYRP